MDEQSKAQESATSTPVEDVQQDNFEVVHDEADSIAQLLNITKNELLGVTPEADDDSKSKDKEDPTSAIDDKHVEDAKDESNDTNDTKPKASRFQKRIDRLTKRASDAERRNQELEAKLLKLEQQSERKETPNSDDEPDAADYSDYDDYLNDLKAWKAGGEKSKSDKSDKSDETKEPALSQEFLDARNTFDEMVEDVRDELEDQFDEVYKDFEELVRADDLAMTPDMIIGISELDNPVDVMYHLASNKSEALRIAKMTPRRQIRALTKLEDKLSKPQPKPGKKETNAPPPIDPVRGSSTRQKALSEMSFEEYAAEQNRKEREKGSFW